MRQQRKINSEYNQKKAKRNSTTNKEKRKGRKVKQKTGKIIRGVKVTEKKFKAS